jgi:hypothetical protein
MEKRKNTAVVLLLALMIFLSIFMGIKTNMGWFSLYGGEFEGPLYDFKRGAFPFYKIAIWCALILTHLILVSLPFLTDKKYFNKLLIRVPFLFILFSTIIEPGDIFFLIPFIIVWTTTLVKQRSIEKETNNHYNFYTFFRKFL